VDANAEMAFLSIYRLRKESGKRCIEKQVEGFGSCNQIEFIGCNERSPPKRELLNEYAMLAA
jgi:hypothetical protein